MDTPVSPVGADTERSPSELLRETADGPAAEGRPLVLQVAMNNEC